MRFNCGPWLVVSSALLVLETLDDLLAAEIFAFKLFCFKHADSLYVLEPCLLVVQDALGVVLVVNLHLKQLLLFQADLMRHLLVSHI